MSNHLTLCDDTFMSRLRSRVEILPYARKLFARGARFEAWESGALIGLIAMYCNDTNTHVAHITNVSVLPDWTRKGIATALLQRCIAQALSVQMISITLTVDRANLAAIKLYENNHFHVDSTANPNHALLDMHLTLQGQR